MSSTDVVIVGAGPYGLSLAAHLRARGVAHRIYGQPMGAWRRMPRMYLKAFGFMMDVAAPGGLTYVDYCREHGLESWEPCAIEDYERYGLTIQREFVPDLVRRHITRVRDHAKGFEVTDETGERVTAANVVIATGVDHYATLPKELGGLPNDRVRHSLDVGVFDQYRDRDVCVLGAGQSALQAAALLHRAGARPRLVVRSETIDFHQPTPQHRPLLERLRTPMSGAGPGYKKLLVSSMPRLIHWQSEAKRASIITKSAVPAGAWWLRDDVVGKMPEHTGTRLEGSTFRNGRIVLHAVDRAGARRDFECDHVIAGTGFDIDVDRLRFIDADLRRRVVRERKAPRLDDNFQTSVPGLHMIGPTSMPSFGRCSAS